MRKCLPQMACWSLLAILLLATPVKAQRPAHYEGETARLQQAMDLFDKAQYGAALYAFDRIAERQRDPHADLRIEAEFWGAISAVRLFRDDAPNRLMGFIDTHPENFHVPAVRLELFRYSFEKKRWKDVLAWAMEVDPTALTANEAEEFAFKKGYAHFMQNDPDRALIEFAKLKGNGGVYDAPATYYTAHINYEKGNHAAALEDFQKLENNPDMAKVVPYYIAQIMFLQGRYDDLLEYAKPLLDGGEGGKNKAAINRLAGEAYYRTGQYAQALPYIEKSLQRVGVERGDRYIAGYTYYRTQRYEQAITQFTQVVNNAEDSLAQLAVYHMADCYLQLNRKTYARNAFKRAYDLGNDQRVTEDALFNYAKLAYELSFDPYNEAIIALKDYMAKYPDSDRHDEAQEFLLEVYLKTRNYEAALEALDAIQHKDLRLKEAYQKLAFDRGVELYEARKYEQARTFFQKALKWTVVPEVTVQTHYWDGEACYAMGDYVGALAKYDDVRNSPGAYAGKLYEQASYSMGYAFFKLRDYPEAATAFRRTAEHTDLPKAQRDDALIRTGDCYYVTKDFNVAITWYDKAINNGAAARDYAQYQKAVCLGLERKDEQKIAVLRQLLREKPNSQYAADAKFQLGETYLNSGNDNEALAAYKQVVLQHPHSPHVRQSMLQVALIDKRQGRTEQAMEGFKEVVRKYPTMDGARDALAGIESIYSEQGNMAGYEQYINSLAFVDPASLDLDEKYFRSAEQLYFDEKCEQAVGAFKDYLNKYPAGAYVLNAEFYAADCLYRTDRAEEALPGFQRVADAGPSQFEEPALLNAARILFAQERWAAALPYYERLATRATLPVNVLTGQTGRMRCLVNMQQTGEAAQAAADVLANDGADAHLKAEANLVMARGEVDDMRLEAAYTRLEKVAKPANGALGAEAAYWMAYVRYLQHRYEEAEQRIFDLARNFNSYDHWKAKAFILLGDVYIEMGDLFQARATLQSIVDNSNEPELVEQAAKRLLNITEAAEPDEPMEEPGEQDIIIPEGQ